MTGRIPRREFIGAVGAGAGAAALSRGTTLAAEAKPKATVVKARREKAVAEGKPNADVVKQMVHVAVMRLAGAKTPAEAWARYVKPKDVVGVKINALFGVGAATNPCVTAAVVEGCRMAGVPADNIICWDREDKHLKKSGYTVQAGKGVKYVGVNNRWEEKPTAIHTCQGRLARVLTQECTALINVPMLKSHSIAGMTFSMKNHYGSFHNPWKAHANGCDPFLPKLNALNPIRAKTRLIVGDVLLPVADRGPRPAPRWVWPAKTILAATDTVAIDTVALQILEAQRAKVNRPSLRKTGKATYVQTAAKMGLGVGDLAQIEVVEV
jgi:uncharacterized protein (DUF362 family)